MEPAWFFQEKLWFVYNWGTYCISIELLNLLTCIFHRRLPLHGLLIIENVHSCINLVATDLLLRTQDNLITGKNFTSTCVYIFPLVQAVHKDPLSKQGKPSVCESPKPSKLFVALESVSFFLLSIHNFEAWNELFRVLRGECKCA